ncbi:MAG: thiamine diphosphokinase [Candidatus Kapabacteria bacterium]|nr:thiamine diphosphokinase [Ignavibacteriota bacterium]MCW5885297.1 thiamine diphosphokinase [Candidatus Kapabacteria bacterium]
MNIKELKFIESQFEAIICLNANLPDKEFYLLFNGIKIIAADGAAYKLKSLGIQPDIIIGDFDSLEPDKLIDDFAGSEILKVSDQDSNDFEKVLKHCMKSKLKNLLITGIHGGELEHTLNNLSVLVKYCSELNFCVYDSGRYGILVSESLFFVSMPYEIISLIPQPKARLTTKNLRWELKDDVLEFGIREGARNESSGQCIEIELHEGRYLLFIDSREPSSPILK